MSKTPEAKLLANQRWRARNRERISEYNRERYALQRDDRLVGYRERYEMDRGTPEARERQRQAAARQRAANPERVRATARRAFVKWRYGITPSELRGLYASQGGSCGICGTPEEPDRRLHVDHNHETGLVRGLLCPRCNLLVARVEGARPVSVDRQAYEDWIARPGIGRGSREFRAPLSEVI